MPGRDEDSYPPIADYGVIGDCHTAALVSRAGAIEWCCLPRFDSGSAFAAILDRKHGGICSISPVGEDRWEYSREYVQDTLVLETRMDGPTGEVKLIDCFLISESARSKPYRHIARIVEGIRGSVELEVRIAPCFDYGEVRPWIRRHGHRLRSAIGGNDGLLVWCEADLEEDPDHELSARVQIGTGERMRLSIGYHPPELIDAGDIEEPDAHTLDEGVEQTIKWWQRFAKLVELDSPDQPSARRSAIALKALTHAPTGAIVAALTTSLPEVIGGPRNWDYRYAWVRDSSFSSRAFAAVGCDKEADAFRAFIMRSAAGHAEDLQILYGVGGERRISCEEVSSLEGYRGSAPARVGNDARSQLQLDAYGELVNLTWRWHRRGHSPSDDHWRFLVSLIDHAAEQWTEPDCGIWEWPGKPDHFVHSKVLCWSALDRGVRLADECMRKAPTRRWKQARDEIREAVDRRGYDRKRGIYVQAFDRNELDCALLLLPTVEFVAWDDERMLRTIAAIREELDAGNGLLYRYLRPDGLKGREGAFLCCSFWLSECLARAGDLPEARRIFDLALATANDVSLFSEEIDPGSGDLLGNFPQGLTHLSHINAAVALAEAAPGP
jgi:GH15 family glucan-1,4-alpha-glucosidase